MTFNIGDIVELTAFGKQATKQFYDHVAATAAYGRVTELESSNWIEVDWFCSDKCWRPGIGYWPSELHLSPMVFVLDDVE